MNINSLAEVLLTEPKYRLKQAYKAVFVDLISDWSETTVLPLNLREKLNQECSLKINAEILTSAKDEAAKAILKLEDGLKVETVLIRHKDHRNTVCVSSQAGCALGCVFCATGQMGFKRNLTANEIVEQVLFFARYLKKQNKKITNIVFMGMGEPFLNYDNVMTAIKTIHDPEGMNLGARHFSVSTAGIVDGIRKLAKEKLEINLAISLHAPTDAQRIELMPIGKKYTIKRIMDAVEYYVGKTNRRVMFEYLLIAGLNNSTKDAKALAGLMNSPLYFINLITCNPTGEFFPPTSQQQNAFKNTLAKLGVKVTERQRFGREIKGACGQLANNKKVD